MKKCRTKPTLRARRLQRLLLLESTYTWFVANLQADGTLAFPCTVYPRYPGRYMRSWGHADLTKVKFYDMPAELDKLNWQLFGLSYATLEKLKRE